MSLPGQRPRWRKLSRRRLLRSGMAIASGSGALLAVGCTGGDGAPVQAAYTPPTVAPTPSQPQPGGTLRVLAGPLGPLPDPHTAGASSETLLWQWAGNFLYRYSTAEPYLVEPDLAAALPEISDDGMTFIIQLRADGKWQNRAPVNGRGVDAEDVKASFERIKQLGPASPRAGNYVNVESISVIDPHTVKFRLKSPQADLLNVMGDQHDIVVPKELAARVAGAFTTPADVIGSGAYELETYEAGRRFGMKRRLDGYWRPNTAWLDGFELLDLRDDGQKGNALLAEQGDAAELPPVLARIFDARQDFVVSRTPSMSRECVVINHAAAKWNDPRVRLAASRAIDRRAVYAAAVESEGVVGGPMAVAAKQWTLSESELETLPGYTADRTSELAEATKLLAAAGLQDGFEDAIVTVGSLKMDLVAQSVAASLAEIGIRLQIQVVGDDFALLTQRARSGQFTLIATMALAGIYPDAQLYGYHHTGGSTNYGKYSNAELDAKLVTQRGMYDASKRVALVKEIQHDIVRSPGPLWLGSRLTATAVSERVHGLTMTPFVSGYDAAEHTWLAP